VRDFKNILSENKSRYDKLFGYYNPMFGINSDIPRIPFKVYKSQKTPILIPEPMHDLEQVKNVLSSGEGISLEEYSHAEGLNFDKERFKFTNSRLDHDFEFWAFTGAKIKPKKGDSDSDKKTNSHLVPFLLNPPQRKVLAKLESMRVNGRPIRVILLKSRQWGGSTLVQIYMSWIQIRHKKSWNSLIAAHLNQASSNIRGMYSTLIKNYPIDKMDYGSFEGTQNIRVLRNRNNKITIGSMQTPDSIRSEDVAMAHLSEVGLWRKTEGKSPEDLIQSIVGTIPNLPLTLLCLESTAKGVGNYFHNTWLEAKKSRNLEPCFIGWFEIPDYTVDFESQQEKEDLFKNMNDYEQYLWKAGATLEGIKWYRMKLAMFNGDTARMASEFPSNDKEAFQSSGQRYFAFQTVQKAREFNLDPILTGEVYADALQGPESLNNIKIDKDPNGNLKVWSMPDPEPYKNRYLVTVDIGGRSKKADDSVIKVFDRVWLSEGGMLEPAAVWAGKIDFDQLAWKAVQICKLYNDAFMIPETNKMREDTSKFDEGDQFYTLVDEIIDYYDNIFCRTNPEQVRQGLPRVYGFHMTQPMKNTILSALNAAYRDQTYAEFDVRACDQADSFENKGNGKTGAVEGAHDDHVIVSALGAWGGIHYMEPCYKVDPEDAKKLMRKGPGVLVK
jgi:hypothetical protein